MDMHTWHTVLESHHNLLNKHLETIILMQQNLQDGSDAAQMLHSCANQTETVLQTFKVAAYRFMAELHSQALPQPTHTNGPPTPIVGGVSGPTPAEQIQQSHSARRTVIGTKRNAAAEESAPAQPSISSTSRPLKRVRAAVIRRSGTAMPQTCQATASPQPPRATVEEDCESGDDDNEDDGTNDDNDNSENDDDHLSYLEAVEAKLKEKEEKMWKRMVKKRKRSPDDIDGVFREQTKTPLLARLRKKNLLVTTKVDGYNIEESAPKSQLGKKSNDAGHMEENLPRVGAKKLRATRNKGTVTG